MIKIEFAHLFSESSIEPEANESRLEFLCAPIIANRGTDQSDDLLYLSLLVSGQ